MVSLDGTTALVTGASRGVGKGIAVGLGEAGATVYVTGRTLEGGKHSQGSIKETAKAVTEAGGEGIPIRCDHRNDDQVEELFERIEHQSGELDILVNNVWGGYEAMFSGDGEYVWEKPFWEQQVSQWDLMFASGVRAHYVASRHAAKGMARRKSGLIVNISFWSAQKYIANVAYGVSKAATDKLTFDMARELKSYEVAVVSLYPGLVRTERVMEAAEYLDLGNSESPQFIGRVISAIAADPQKLEKTGSVQIAAQLGLDYGVKDIDGKQPEPLSLEDV